MKNLSLAISLALSTTPVFADEFKSTGARYPAQGGDMVANANDSFGLTVNPANLLTHSNEFDVLEFAANLTHKPEMGTNNDMLGGYKSFANFIFGGSFESSTGTDSFEEFFSDPRQGIETSQNSIAAAFGNTVSADESLTYGVGVVYTWIDIDDPENKNTVDESGVTGTAKVSYQSKFDLQTNSLIFDITLGAAYSPEILTELNEEQFSVKPQIARVGISTRFSHFNSSIPWDITLSGEHLSYKFTAQSLMPIEYEKESRVGLEWTLIRPLGTDGDFSIRAGMSTFDSVQQDHHLSAGFGYTSGNWSLDISTSEHGVDRSDRSYNLSVSYTFID